MKTTRIFICTVVLWTLVETRHAGRLGRSLDVEGKGSNLTQKQQQEVIHADVLQHFTATPSSSGSHEITTHDSTSSFIKDVPFIPEDINVQNLKNDDHLRVTYDRRITIDKENPNKESSEDKNKTLKTNTNDVISYKYNQSGHSSSSRSEVLISHSSYEHKSSSVVYDEDDEIHEKDDGTHSREYQPVSSTTETLKLDPERKIFDVKKKEKSKKEILDSATVPSDHNGAGRIEKPFKDNIISVKLKEKNKDSISEALDERRSTTIRISSSSSISVSEHDNKPLDSVDIVRVSSTGTNNKESVNQSVNSVININGVNSGPPKKPRVKYSVKRVHDDTNEDEDNISASGSVLNEDSVKNVVPGFNSEFQTTPTPVQTGTTSAEKLASSKQYSSFRRSQFVVPTPTKIDILGKTATTSSTTIIKPSIAFKQQLANKLKGLDPAPTAPMVSSDDEIDEVQEKTISKSATKSNLKKKPKLEHPSSSEMYIPPTATAWTLVSMKSAPDALRTSRKPISLLDISSSTSSENPASPSRYTTITPISRVKSFVPWSTRLLKNSNLKPPATPSIDEFSSTEQTNTHTDSQISSSSSVEKVQEDSEVLKASEHMPSSTEEQSVIRSTVELDRNMTESSVIAVKTFPNDIMVKDQSSTVPHGNFHMTENSAVEGKEILSSVAPEQHLPENTFRSEVESQVVEKENIIETKQAIEENDTHSLKEAEHIGIVEENTTSKSDQTGSTGKRVSLSDVSENVNEIKPSLEKQGSNDVLIAAKTSPTPDVIDPAKMKNISDVSELDPGASDILVDGPGEDGKSGEDSDEDYKPKQTTTLPPMFEPFETTVISDLDEEIEGESEREDEELPIIINKLTNQTTNESSATKEANLDVKPTMPTLSGPLEINNTGTYVTSFDIISKENTTQVVTRTPSEGDINWYSVDTKLVNASMDETSPKTTPVEIATTAAMETTIEPETTTESSEQETTVLPESTGTVTPVSSTTSTSVMESTVTLENGTDLENVDDANNCVRIVVHVSPVKLCHGQRQLQESIAAQLSSEDVSWEQILIMNKGLQDCETKELSTSDQDLDVVVCFVEENQEPSLAIRNEFLKLYAKRIYDSSFPIVKVQMIMDPTIPSGFDNVLAAIILSVIAAICLVLLGILLVIIRKRQGRFNYGQRCTPVSLDDYSLDNISVYNSVRRKGALRASKRSYGNPGFDDPGGPSHPINFSGLANISIDREALDEEFNQIPMITVKPDELPPGAESKNRYANVIPLPETRVPLQPKEGADPLDEYINANYIKNTKTQAKLYIACQAPLQSTVEDFWRMVWQQQAKVILMLTSLTENGVDKCADYLPQLEITDCHRLFGDFQVTLKKHEVREKYIISSLQLKNLETNLWREVTHLWYSSWPAQGVPEDGSAMIAFLIEARSYMRGAQGPTVVHCSPGTGRTGTVVAIDLCIRDFETLRTVDIPKTVYALRRDRAGAVQTKDQYAFIYQVLNLYATKLTGGALDSI